MLHCSSESYCGDLAHSCSVVKRYEYLVSGVWHPMQFQTEYLRVKTPSTEMM